MPPSTDMDVRWPFHSPADTIWQACSPSRQWFCQGHEQVVCPYAQSSARNPHSQQVAPHRVHLVTSRSKLPIWLESQMPCACTDDNLMLIDRVQFNDIKPISMWQTVPHLEITTLTSRAQQRSLNSVCLRQDRLQIEQVWGWAADYVAWQHKSWWSMQRLTRDSSRLQWQAHVVGMDLSCSEPTADLPLDKKERKRLRF